MPDRNAAAEGWSFSRSDAGWEWHYAGSPMVESKRSLRAFPSLIECMNDASLHGYNRRVGPRGEAGDRD